MPPGARGALASDAWAVRPELPRDGRRPIARCSPQEAELQVGAWSALTGLGLRVRLGAGGGWVGDALRGWRRPRGAAGRKRPQLGQTQSV